jgi:AcrR family transcriptional regulator
VKFGAIESRPYLQNKQSKRILEAAKDVFIREGGAAFSARRVAKAAKLSLGSVQHVFPTTDALVTAMLEHVNDGYEAAYKEMAARLPFNAEQRLHAYFDYLLEDVCRQDTRKFWFGFWALGCHNKHAEWLLERAYHHHCNNVASFIGAARPTLTDARCRELATHLVALIEGLMIFTRTGDRRLSIRSPLIRGVRKTLANMLAVDEPPHPVNPSSASAQRHKAPASTRALPPESRGP